MHIFFIIAGIRFLIIFHCRDGVAATEPAAEVDVAATLGAEGLVFLVSGFAADGAEGVRHISGHGLQNRL